MIKEFAFIVYPVSDVERARKFYTETLGLTPGQDFGEMVEFEVGGVTFAIDANPFDSTPGSSVAFEVDDLDAEVARLKSVGVTFKGEIGESKVCRMALLNDPEGNTLCLHERKKP